MFQQILTLDTYQDSQAKLLEEACLFTAFNTSNSTDLLPPMFEQSLESHNENNNKDPSFLVNTEELLLQKLTKEKKKRIRKYTSNNPNNQKGHWTNEQNLKYHYFLQLHALHFIDNQRRKSDKIFKSMANFIGTRQAHQCRSHHQKVQKKWESFLNILSNLRLQNFKKTDPSPLIKQLQSLGYHNPSILSQHDLLHSDQLYQKLLNNTSSTQETYEKLQEPKTQSFIDQLSQIQENFLRCHKQNCMCLMMSETYEDQLLIQ